MWCEDKRRSDEHTRALLYASANAAAQTRTPSSSAMRAQARDQVVRLMLRIYPQRRGQLRILESYSTEVSITLSPVKRDGVGG